MKKNHPEMKRSRINPVVLSLPRGRTRYQSTSRHNNGIFTWNMIIVVITFICVSLYFTTTNITIITIPVCVASNENIDLYKVLGVKRTASTKEIKSAYRRKALNTHPDKNRDKSPDVAAEEFRQVVTAFEVLSDTKSRNYYDRTGRINSNNGGGGNNNQQQNHRNFHQFHFHWNYYQRRPQKLKDRFDVQQAISRVLHVISLEQLRTIMLDENEKFERNVVICFTTAQIDQYVDDEMVYPYPFAAMSSQGIWWEDLLQTIKVRFYVSNEITKFFGVTAYEIDSTKAPVFMFGKRGTHIEDVDLKFNRLQTRDRVEFENWMWKQIEVRVGFHNQHTYPIEIYWVHETTAQKQVVCPVNEVCWLNTMLSHEFYIRDTRIDTHPGAPGRHKLTTQSSLGSFKILSDEDSQIFIIKTKSCMDLSGHCPFYRMHNECLKNPGFMNEYCALTCGICSTTDDDKPPPTNNDKQESSDDKRNSNNHREENDEL